MKPKIVDRYKVWDHGKVIEITKDANGAYQGRDEESKYPVHLSHKVVQEIDKIRNGKL